MKLKHAIAAGSLLLGLSGTSLGQGPSCAPCIDRPTPPPCCADGKCFASPLYGYYPTRWRTWPVEPVSPTSNQQFNPEKVQQEVPPFVLPPAVEEDRKAPPPTTPREETNAGSRAPSAGGPNATTPAGEGGPAGPSGSNGPTTPIRPPADNEPTGPRRTLPPYTPQSNPGGSSLNGRSPTGEVDPPPALPFGPIPMQTAQPAHVPPGIPVAPSAAPKLVPPQATGVNLKSDDPPPALPGTLAGLGN